MKSLYLGIIYKLGFDNKYHPINHRSILKILLNPLLRKFGYFINSVYSEVDDNISGLEISKLEEKFNVGLLESYKNSLSYPYDKNTMKIKKESTWF